MAAVFTAPGRYVQGRGAIDALGEVLEQLGSSRPLILRDEVVAGVVGEGPFEGMRRRCMLSSAASVWRRR